MTSILLIEDNKSMRENTAELLSLSGYQVITAQNGKEGVRIAKEKIPDLIICDIMMPELDGYGVLHILSKEPQTATIPFVFLTAKTEQEDFRKGMNLGADDYVTKPFTELDLMNAIESRLKKSQLLKKEFSKGFEGINELLQEVSNYSDLKDLSGSAQTKTFKKKQIIFHEGAYPHGIYYLKSGKVKAYKTNEFSKEFITNLFKPGDFFGYIAQINEEPYEESTEALEESELAIIPKDDFVKLIYYNQDVSVKFIKLLSQNIKESEDKLLELAYNSVRKRVAQSLVTLHDKYNPQNKPLFSMPMAREDLASIVGTSKESVTRTLSDFKDEKLIGLKGSTITIYDLEKLVKMKN